MRSLLQRVVVLGVVQSHMEFIMESGVMFIVVTCRRVVGSRGDPLQKVEQNRGHHRGLPESSGLSAEARLGHLKEWGSSV